MPPTIKIFRGAIGNSRCPSIRARLNDGKFEASRRISSNSTWWRFPLRSNIRIECEVRLHEFGNANEKHRGDGVVRNYHGYAEERINGSSNQDQLIRPVKDERVRDRERKEKPWGTKNTDNTDRDACNGSIQHHGNASVSKDDVAVVVAVVVLNSVSTKMPCGTGTVSMSSRTKSTISFASSNVIEVIGSVPTLT